MMRQPCLTRCFLAYTTLCGIAVAVFAFWDLSSTLQVLPPIRPILDWSFLLPENVNFCNVEIFNESELQVMVVSNPEPDSVRKRRDWPKRSFDLDRSTEENYAAGENGQLVGRFATIRKELDYSYHRIYTEERQQLQDRILSSLLQKTVRLGCPSSEGETLKSEERWIVFTAGVMGAGKTRKCPTFAWIFRKRRHLPSCANP